MKHRQFQRVVVTGNPQPAADDINDMRQLVDHRDRYCCCHRIENQVCTRQSPAFDIGAHGAEYRGHGGADICADSQRQRILIGDLLGCKRGDDQHQGCMTGLHHHRGDQPQQRKQKNPRIAGDGIGSEVDGVLEGIKALFHVMNAEKQEPQAGQHITDSLEFLALLKNQNDAEDDHRHGVGGYFDFEAKAGHQPSTGCCAKIGAEDDTDAGGKRDQSG